MGQASSPLILVVDDDPVLHLIAEEEITHAGWRFHGVSDGRAALEYVSTVRPDLILLDVHMPGLDGFDTCRELKREVGADVPVLFMTSDDDFVAISNAYDAGASSFETKPINWQLLRHRLRYVLRNSEMRTQLKAAATALQESTSRVLRAQKVARMASWELSPQGDVLHVEAGAEHVLGVADCAVPANLEALAALSPEGQQEKALADFQTLVTSGEPGDFKQVIGGSVDAPRRIVRVHGEPDTARGSYSGYFQDVTEQEQTAQEIWRLAYLDNLTRLPNQYLFSELLARELARCKRTQSLLAVLYMDLDGYKRINETLGRATGDKVLETVAARLQAVVREHDVLARSDGVLERPDRTARLSGDSFAVILADLTDASEAQRVALRVIENISKPIEVGESIVSVTPGIGISIAPVDGETADTLLARANVAVRAAKSAGAGECCFFDMEVNAVSRERLRVTAALHDAIANDELHLVYQPQVDVLTGRVSRVEALLRWDHPVLGDVSPDVFIPLAEEHGLIVSIGDWVLNAALEQLHAWRSAGSEIELVTVNLSTAQFTQIDFAERVERMLKAYALPASALELELTETLLARDPRRARNMVLALRNLGVRFSIDDFGTGYSSLSYLKDFPVDILKIDRSFVRDLESNADDAVIVSTISRLADALGIATVAEGVETLEQLRLVSREGCHLIQGFYFARPMPSVELNAWLALREQRDSILPTRRDAGVDVLVVDKDSFTARLLARALEQKGFRAVTAATGNDALYRLAKQRPAVVLSGVEMPDMDGIALLSRVRGMYPDSIRMLAGSDTDKDLVIEAMNDGIVSRFVRIPVDIPALCKHVSGALRADVIHLFQSG